MKAVIIGGKGKVGTYLIPELINIGYDVINVSRGSSSPFLNSSEWDNVEQVCIDREAETAAGTFGKKIADLKPDVVIDMVCFNKESMMHLVDALRGKIAHYLCCGSIWIHGHFSPVPTDEYQCRKPIDDYGIGKEGMEYTLRRECLATGFPATTVHPGHIVGPGHAPLNPQANRNNDVYKKLMNGEPLPIPGLGMETLHHVHASDVAQVFIKAILNPSVSIGEQFHAAAAQAITLREFAEAVASWFGKKANLQFMPFEEFAKHVSEEDAAATLEHISHSPCASIERAKRLLGYAPKYTALEAVRESVEWLIANGEL